MADITELKADEIEAGVLAIRRALMSGSLGETRWALVRTYEVARESLQYPHDTRFMQSLVAHGLMQTLLRLTELTTGIAASGIPAAPEYAGAINGVGRSAFQIGVDIPASAATQEADAAIMDTHSNCVNPTELSPVELVVWICIMATDYVRFRKGVAMTAFIACGGIPRFMQLLAEPEHMPLRTVEYILWALGNLTVASSEVCSALYSAGVISAAVRVLRAAFALPAGTPHRRNALCNAIWAVSMLQAWEEQELVITDWSGLAELAGLLPALGALGDAEVFTYVCRTLHFFTMAMGGSNVRAGAAAPTPVDFGNDGGPDTTASAPADGGNTADPEVLALTPARAPALSSEDLSLLISAEADLIKAAEPYAADTPAPTPELCSAMAAASERAAIAGGVRAVRRAPGSIHRVTAVFQLLIRLATGRCALARAIEGGAHPGVTNAEAADAILASADVIADAFDAVSALLSLGLEKAWSSSFNLPNADVRAVFQWLATPRTAGSASVVRARTAAVRFLSENFLLPDLTPDDDYPDNAFDLPTQRARALNVSILMGIAVLALEQQQAEARGIGTALAVAGGAQAPTTAAWTFARAYNLLCKAVAHVSAW